MYKLMSLTLVVCFFCLQVVAQAPRPTSPAASRVQVASRGPAKQWEYLVVSFGKTRFSDPNSEPETKTAGLSKLLSYSKLGVVSATEALTVEWQMDTLGKFGWELVGIVGAIGGDQQMVFRRAYDSDQSKAEATLIREEGERLLAVQRKETVELPQAEFVDLDALERATATAETRRKEELRLKTTIEGLKNPAIVDMKIVSTAGGPNDSQLNAEVVVDGSNLLTEGNKYRSSQVYALAKAVALSIYEAAGLKQDYSFSDPSSGYYSGEVKISASVRVSFQGKQKIASSANVGGKWPERKRSL